MEKKVYILKISREENELILVTTNVIIGRNGPVQTHPTLRRVVAPGPKLRKHRRGVSLEVRMLNLGVNMR